MKHISVLKNEVIKKLNIKNGGTYVDATLGLGGHSNEILKNLKNGTLIMFDQDEKTLNFTKNKINQNGNKVFFVNNNFRNLNLILKSLKITKIDGILYDLGPSYYQLVNPKRGFTFHNENIELDMRMNQNQKIDAKYILNNYSSEDLTKIFIEFGEEKHAQKIANLIVEKRKEKNIKTNTELNQIIKSIKGFNIKKHSSRNVYQALRIAVNDEFEVLKESLKQAVQLLNIKGKILVITFHSLEDKIVKNYFWKLKEMKLDSEFQTLYFFRTNKTIYPTTIEKQLNKSSRSAKLRVLEKINEPNFIYWN